MARSQNTTPAVHINHFGIIPKKQMALNYRLIFPKSVNDAIDPKLCSQKYITVEQEGKEATALGKGSLIAKINIKTGYCLIPVALKDHSCLGMKYEGKVFIDAMLPFGLCLAPKFLMEWQMHWSGV